MKKLEIKINKQKLAALLREENQNFLRNNKIYKLTSNIQTDFEDNEINRILILSDGGDKNG